MDRGGVERPVLRRTPSPKAREGHPREGDSVGDVRRSIDRGGICLHNKSVLGWRWGGCERRNGLHAVRCQVACHAASARSCVGRGECGKEHGRIASVTAQPELTCPQREPLVRLSRVSHVATSQLFGASGWALMGCAITQPASAHCDSRSLQVAQPSPNGSSRRPHPGR
jgi:hypothetical protein